MPKNDDGRSDFLEPSVPSWKLIWACKEQAQSGQGGREGECSPRSPPVAHLSSQGQQRQR